MAVNLITRTSKSSLTNIRPYRFVLTFAACMLFGFGVLLTPPVQSVDGEFSRGLVKVSHALLVAGGGHATCSGAILRAPGGFAVEMRDGCNAINVTILLWSAVLAFPAPWKMKGLGLAAGTLVISGAQRRPLHQPLLPRTIQHGVVRLRARLPLGEPAGAGHDGGFLALGQPGGPTSRDCPCRRLSRRSASFCAVRRCWADYLPSGGLCFSAPCCICCKARPAASCSSRRMRPATGPSAYLSSRRCPATPQRQAQQIHSVDFDIRRSDAISFTFGLPVFWAIILAAPGVRRCLRRATGHGPHVRGGTGSAGDLRADHRAQCGCPTRRRRGCGRQVGASRGRIASRRNPIPG